MIYIFSMIALAALCIVALVGFGIAFFRVSKARDEAERRAAEERETQFDSIVNHVLKIDNAAKGKVNVDEIQLAKETCVEMSKSGMIEMTPEEIYKVIGEFTNKQQFRFIKRTQAAKRKHEAVTSIISSFALKPEAWVVANVTVRTIQLILKNKKLHFTVDFTHPQHPEVHIKPTGKKNVSVEYKIEDAKFLTDFMEHIAAMNEVSALDGLEDILED